MTTGGRALGAVFLALLATEARAEAIFLSRQYTRCTTCHFSATGGGMLTPYGRALSRELSTTGAARAEAPSPARREEDFLWGVFGDRLGNLTLGMDARPAHLRFDLPVGDVSRNFVMTLDLIAAYQTQGWTIYGEVGRQPEGGRVDSYEYWAGYQPGTGYGFRAGRFLPAYGFRLADHTAFTRAGLGLDAYDQVFAVELSRTTDRSLLQVSAGPGRADSILHDDQGPRALTTAARFQMDFGSRTMAVASALFRAGRLNGGGAGLAVGHAPFRRVTVLLQADAHFRRASIGERSYTLFGETSVEVHRGIWLRFTPQLRTAFGDPSGGVVRLAAEATVLPRTHWHVDVSFYRDRVRNSDIVVKAMLAQLHLY